MYMLMYIDCVCFYIIMYMYLLMFMQHIYGEIAALFFVELSMGGLCILFDQDVVTAAFPE